MLGIVRFEKQNRRHKEGALREAPDVESGFKELIMLRDYNILSRTASSAPVL